MNKEQAYELMKRYRGLYGEYLCVTSKEEDVLLYTQNMVDRVVIEEFDDGKANRWLGFMQGLLFSEEIYSVEELKQHVRDFKEYTEEVRETPAEGGVLETGGVQGG